MPNTYTQLYIHFVFAVKYRQAMILPEWEERLRLYMIGIAQNDGHKIYAINNMPDHMHIFLSLNPAVSISETMKLIKGQSSEWINKQKLTKQIFRWQEGYGAFSHSKTQIDAVVKYINNQKEHHKKISFRDEYKKMLTDFGVEYDERYIFHDPLE